MKAAPMKKPNTPALCLAALACSVMLAAPAAAQDRIYRCGNEYTNGKVDKRKDCKLIEGGNVTVISGYRPPAGAAPRSGAGGGASSGAPAGANLFFLIQTRSGRNSLDRKSVV